MVPSAPLGDSWKPAAPLMEIDLLRKRAEG
jgi:hypothetical protein